MRGSVFSCVIVPISFSSWKDMDQMKGFVSTLVEVPYPGKKGKGNKG